MSQEPKPTDLDRLLDDIVKYAQEIQRCSTGHSTAARRARGRLQFTRQQVHYLVALHAANPPTPAATESPKP